MQNIIKWFAAAFGAMFGITIGALVTAAPGDLIYQTGGARQEIRAADALCFATCALNTLPEPLWDGVKADMVSCRAMRDNSYSSGFAGVCVGLKTSAPGDLPVTNNPVQVVGIVE